MRKNYSSGAKWEDIVGYSRAVQIGNTLEITGTVATDEAGAVVGKNNMYAQTKYILKKIQNVLMQAEFSISDVVRTRMFVTDISQWQEAGRAHAEVFALIKPCTTMVEVSRLIEPDYMIEIEVTAIKM